MKLFSLIAATSVFLCAQAPRQLPITDMPRETVIAKADGKPITAGEVRDILGVGDPKAINMASMNPEQFLVNISVMKFLAAEADKAHLAEESPLKEELQYMRNQIVANAMVNRYREVYNVPDTAIEEFYKKNSSRYEQASIKAIVIGFCPALATPTGTSDEELRRIAKEAFDNAHCESKHSEAEGRAIAAKVEAELKAGADFVKLVAKYSEDKESQEVGGDYPLVTRTSSYKDEIKSGVFALKTGDISEPIRSGNYLYIIKVKERTVQPLAAVHEPIVQELKQKHFTDWMQEISVRFKPVIDRPDFFVKPTDPKPNGPAQLVPQP